MKLQFSSATQLELAEAVRFYENQQDGLGLRFLTEVENTVARIHKNPETWSRISRRLQRSNVHKFPFALYYHHTKSETLIVAVADLRRDPRRWEDIL